MGGGSAQHHFRGNWCRGTRPTVPLPTRKGGKGRREGMGGQGQAGRSFRSLRLKNVFQREALKCQDWPLWAHCSAWVSGGFGRGGHIPHPQCRQRQRGSAGCRGGRVGEGKGPCPRGRGHLQLGSQGRGETPGQKSRDTGSSQSTGASRWVPAPGGADPWSPSPGGHCGSRGLSPVLHPQGQLSPPKHLGRAHSHPPLTCAFLPIGFQPILSNKCPLSKCQAPGTGAVTTAPPAAAGGPGSHPTPARGHLRPPAAGKSGGVSAPRCTLQSPAHPP